MGVPGTLRGRCEAEIKAAKPARFRPWPGGGLPTVAGMRVLCPLLAAAGLLAGCALPVRETSLQGLAPVQTLQWRSFVDERLRGQVQLGEFKGADPEARGYVQKTLERVWESRTPAKPVVDALEEQLMRLRLLANAAQPARYVLDVEILRLAGGSLPLAGDGEAELRYRLRESDSGRLVYERRLRSQGEVNPALLWPPARQRAAKESALRANLLLLAHELVRLRV